MLEMHGFDWLIPQRVALFYQRVALFYQRVAAMRYDHHGLR